MNVTYDAYQNVAEGKNDFCVHVKENGNSRLVFFGGTKAEAMDKAAKWANANLDTPERREMTKKRGDALRERMAKKAAQEAA